MTITGIAGIPASCALLMYSIASKSKFILKESCTALESALFYRSSSSPSNSSGSWAEQNCKCVLLSHFAPLSLRSLFKVTKGSPLGDTLSLSCEASVGTSGSNN